MRTATTITITTSCLLIAGAVLLSGLRAKEFVSAIPSAHLDAGHHATDDSTRTAKVTPELHHHSDTTLKVQIASDGHQADTRSLRLLHEHKKERVRVANRHRHWWQFAFVQYS